MIDRCNLHITTITKKRFRKKKKSQLVYYNIKYMFGAVNQINSSG